MVHSFFVEQSMTFVYFRSDKIGKILIGCYPYKRTMISHPLMKNLNDIILSTMMSAINGAYVVLTSLAGLCSVC